eukprot:CAMPEP_0174254162 /NCGR_PEP_ID=MMETSP0439-20130205/3511_1 /TAXON_ID=0 /ORGANISM="Stereomyxa ramosa, Strain Chinc5" /LENGTH=225 /DNA_ID=CAMNT_0015335603 /DNA_START=113 /DNA_END=790 /DNA_ORIENTATION=-
MTNEDNRFSPTFITELHSALDFLDALEDTPKALISTGTGKFFSNGLDQVHMMSNPDNLTEYLKSFQRLCARFLTFPIPTIAAINGHAYAGGLLFALAHDYVIMREDRGFCCMPEVFMPAPIPAGLVALLKLKLNRKTLKQAVLSGKRYGGKEAKKAKIVDDVASEEDLLPKALLLAQQVQPPNSVKGVVLALKEELYSNALTVLLSDNLGGVAYKKNLERLGAKL